MRTVEQLSEKELLALAIGAEEEDSRIYATFAENLRENYPSSAKMFSELADEENTHRRRLLDLFEKKFGTNIPLVRRQDVRGFIQRKPVWMTTSAATRSAATPRKWRTTRRGSIVWRRRG